MTVYYFYDALCGWCYGFSPVLQKFYENHRDEADFRVVSGGMIVGERIGPIFEVAPYIRSAYKEVEAAAGVTFGEAFLKNMLAEGTTVMTSVPPAVALTIFAEKFPDRQVEFAAELQRAIYYDGVPPEDTAAYAERAAKFGFDADEFNYKISSQEYHERARADFKLTQQFGIQGFPALVVQIDDEYFLLARGFTRLETLERVWGKILTDVRTRS